MFDWDLKKKVIISTIASLVVFSCGFYFARIYQSPAKTDEIYELALEDFKNGDYQNSYYLFSKISFFSKLKPIAIYHQGECARMLGDEKSELKQYQFLFNNYKKHKLSLRAKYLVAQKLADEKPLLAKKYFENIIHNAPDSDYAIASEYYLGLILANKYKDTDNVPASVIDDVETHYRHYLKKAPSGRLALDVANNWIAFSKNISNDDYLLIANAYYLFNDYAKADEILRKTDLKEGWALDVKNSSSLKNAGRVRALTESGLQKYASYVKEDDVINAIDIYINLSDSKLKAIDRLLTFSTGVGRDYLLNLKCQNLSTSEQASCYSNLYLKYPSGRFSADALSNLFFVKIRAREYDAAIKIGHDHLNKFPNSVSSPMVMYWLGKLAEYRNDYEEYMTYYRSVINKYPDSYYAYRAYLRLTHTANPLVVSEINPQPVVYPYKYTKNNIIVKLVDLKDYDIVDELSGDDEFIKSWVLYKKGDYSHSMLVARDAMDNLASKPDKYDLRWRLVYPVLYYDEISKYADEAGNNTPLMLSLVREESYFDPLAQSVVGASGLMQLMPSTASEINYRYALGMNISDALFNPEKNIKLGNYYYEFLRENLNGHDVSSIAAYNGGIGSIKRWKSTLYYSDTDEFVEQIPYPETKNYVKKVFRSYWNYIRIYNQNN